MLMVILSTIRLGCFDAEEDNPCTRRSLAGLYAACVLVRQDGGSATDCPVSHYLPLSPPPPDFDSFNRGHWNFIEMMLWCYGITPAYAGNTTVTSV